MAWSSSIGPIAAGLRAAALAKLEPLARATPDDRWSGWAIDKLRGW